MTNRRKFEGQDMAGIVFTIALNVLIPLLALTGVAALVYLLLRGFP